MGFGSGPHKYVPAVLLLGCFAFVTYALIAGVPDLVFSTEADPSIARSFAQDTHPAALPRSPKSPLSLGKLTALLALERGEDETPFQAPKLRRVPLSQMKSWSGAFVHIPKAGGTQMSSLLRGIAGDHNHTSCYSHIVRAAPRLVKSNKWNSCELYSAEGTMEFWDGLEQHRLTQPAVNKKGIAVKTKLSRFTILRRPDTLAQSWLHHAQVQGRLRGLNSISAAFDTTACVDPEQQLCKYRQHPALSKLVNAASRKLTSDSLWRDAMLCNYTAQTLLADQALSNLKRLDFVMILEAHDETLCIFFYVYYPSEFDSRCRKPEVASLHIKRQPGHKPDQKYEYNWTAEDSHWALQYLESDYAVYRAGLDIADAHTRFIDERERTNLNAQYRAKICAASIPYLGCHVPGLPEVTMPPSKSKPGDCVFLDLEI